jgi:hypothetical protein
VIQLGMAGDTVVGFGVLYDAVPGKSLMRLACIIAGVSK